ncbi:uncharacterized protein LOC117282271 isoform X2 [Cryptotermes secundus]|uniref:uncharacterized protein LOC117282271 isoform X2 n=1 Tax=Cryptotermes secundus TaxID=105785 RepID=UPI001454CABB|nr:uncharacterized protein LOC117282271 isoform X2 [Cryptotermes secundus]
MSNKELRNRTIGTVGVESDSAAGETEFDWPCGQSETFGQECVVDNGPTPSITANPLEIRAEDGSSNPAVNPDTAEKTVIKSIANEVSQPVTQAMLQNLFAEVLKAISSSSDKLQEGVSAQVSSLQQSQESVSAQVSSVQQSQESVSAQVSSVQQSQESVSAQVSSLRQSQESVCAQVNSLQQSVEEKICKLQESVRADFKVEHDRLIQRFEREQERVSKEFTDKLRTQSEKLTSMVGQLRSETETELIVARQKFAELEEKVSSQATQTKNNTNTLSVKLTEVRNDFEKRVTDEIKMVRDEVTLRTDELNRERSQEAEQVQNRIDRIDSTINKIQNQLSCQADATRSSSIPQNDENCEPVPLPQANRVLSPHATTCSDSTGLCSCKLSSCVICMHEGDNVMRVNAPVRQHVASNPLPISDFSLPQFDEGTGINPVYYLRQLDEFMTVRNIPQAHQLSIACKSITGCLGRQWIEAIRHNLADYAAFRTNFLNAWWSSAQQSLVKCKLYQSKYSRQSGLSLSAHFLKHATSAFYLDPKPTESEVIHAIIPHFPIAKALDVLKRIEIMENQEGCDQYDLPPHQKQPDPDRRNQPPRGHYYQRHDQRNVRNVQMSPSRRNDYYSGSSRHQNNRHQSRNNSPTGSAARQTLNPHAPNFNTNPGRREEGHSSANTARPLN